MSDFLRIRKCIYDEWPVPQILIKSRLAMLPDFGLTMNIKIQRDHFKAQQESLRESRHQSESFRNKQSAHLAIGRLIYLQLGRFDWGSTVTTRATHFFKKKIKKTWAEYFPRDLSLTVNKSDLRGQRAFSPPRHTLSAVPALHDDTLCLAAKKSSKEVKWKKMNRQTAKAFRSQNKMSPSLATELGRGMWDAERRTVFMDPNSYDACAVSLFRGCSLGRTLPTQSAKVVSFANHKSRNQAL